jgi:hypothetical protein
VPSKKNADIIDNSLARQTAYDKCDLRHNCLIDWYVAAKEIADNAKDGKAVPPVPALCK